MKRDRLQIYDDMMNCWNKEPEKTFEESTCWLRPEQTNKWPKFLYTTRNYDITASFKKIIICKVNVFVHVIDHVDFESHPKHQFTGFNIRTLAQHRTGLFLFLGARRFLEIQPWQPFVADMPYSYVFCLPLMAWTQTWPEQTYSITQNRVKELHLPYTFSVRPAIRMFITHLVNKWYCHDHFIKQ